MDRARAVPAFWQECVRHVSEIKQMRTSHLSSYRYKVSYIEYIGVRSEPGELKHLSTRRKGHQTRLR